MSMFTKLPAQFYDVTAFDGFSLDRDFRRGSAKAMAWLSQLSYETDEPKKIEDILRTWKLRLVDDISHTKLAPNLLHVDRLALVGKRRIPSDHEAAGNPR